MSLATSNEMTLTKKKGKSGKRKKSMAEKADRHVLYQNSVQCVEAEIDFVTETFEQLRGRAARALREDFCGTANTACEWVKRDKNNHAVGVDLDPDVLAWGRENNLQCLPGEAAKRISLLCEDVQQVRTEPMDAILAMNFSYWIFEERKTLGAYFSSVRKALKEDGILFLDAFGGGEAHDVVKEKRKCDGFTYVWEQAEFNPITNKMKCYIHFRFRDGSRIERAFSYEWRFWSLPELREILLESGFRKATVYWDSTEDGDGVYEAAESGDPDPGWLCYLVAEK